MNSLNVIGMIVPPGSSHTTRADVVGNDIAVVGETLPAQSADAILCLNLFVHQLPHLGVRTNLPISARVLRIINAADTHLTPSSFLRDGLASAACKRTVNWAQLGSAQSHKMLLEGFGMVYEGVRSNDEEMD
jgi:hypothetical protein